MESLNSNSKEREMQLTQRLVKQRHSHCMAWFEQLETHLRDLYLNSSPHVVDAFKPAFHSFFGEEHQTFRLKMFRNLDQLRLQLEKENLLELDTSQKKNLHYSTSVNENSNYKQHGVFGQSSKKLEVNLITDVKENWLSGRLFRKASLGLSHDKHDTSRSCLRTYFSHCGGCSYQTSKMTKMRFAEVKCLLNLMFLAIVTTSYEQSEPIYDTYLLEKVDSNTTPDSANMCHRGGEIDQDDDTSQAKYVEEASNEAKVKHEINVLETINIELESSVAKLLAENEKLNKENEHLKQTYKELYDSIKKTRIQTKDYNDSLIAQVNSKTVENADLKAQIQEKVFANVALKNELRKLKGNSVDNKFAKPSILGKPVLQPPRNQSVVRKPNAFKYEQPSFSKPRFAPQVDVNNVLSKPVTPHYFPKVREYVIVKPHHVKAPGSSRNSQEESYGSNDMAHNHYLEEARKMTQEKNRNSKPSVMHTTSLQNTTNGSKPNPRSNNQISKSLPVSKSSYGMSNGVSLVEHSRNSSSFSDSKHFVCSTCHKCVFNANHDYCITKFLKEVNSSAKIAIGQRFSPNKSSVMHEKPNTPRSCLRWKSTGRIFKIAGLRWIPTRKMFTDNTTKVDSEPSNGSNDDITNPYECDQTLNVSACTTNLSAVTMADANINAPEVPTAAASPPTR
ncbi:hypothetical protein Tco_0553237, partial [Tanacetum coccineum]